MARKIMQITREDGTTTNLIGITDNGVTMRVHRAHFMPHGRLVQCSYERAPNDPLWAGGIKDMNEDILKRLEAGEVIGNTAPPVKRIARTRPAR